MGQCCSEYKNESSEQEIQKSNIHTPEQYKYPVVVKENIQDSSMAILNQNKQNSQQQSIKQVQVQKPSIDYHEGNERILNNNNEQPMSNTQINSARQLKQDEKLTASESKKDQQKMLKKSNTMTQKKVQRGLTGELVYNHDIFTNMRTGQIRDFYKIGKEIGKGTYGKVYHAYNKRSDQARALKIIKKTQVKVEEEQNFIDELSILRDLDHPNIVKLHELYEDEQHFYIVTEYCMGGELFSKIKQYKQFNEESARIILKQLASAIYYCHCHNIVHRDIKPENILFLDNSPNSELKIIDFGLSRKFTNDTKMRKKLGTPYYIAPEVLNSCYTEKCDIWSLGVILYILLTGIPPFNGSTTQKIFDKIKIGKYDMDQYFWANRSPEVKDLIKRMLDVNIETRISSSELVQHEWFKTKLEITNTCQEQIYKNFSKLHDQLKFKSVIESFIIKQLIAEEDLVELKIQFRKYDQNGDGVISKQELIAIYSVIYSELSEEELERKAASIIEKIDIDKSGYIDYSEFVKGMMDENKIFKAQHIEQAFRMIDVNNLGYINREVLEDFMGEIDEEIWEVFLEECDQDNDGKISKQEFTKILELNTK